jgi:polysaccharide export outer membrane protein
MVPRKEFAAMSKVLLIVLMTLSQLSAQSFVPAKDSATAAEVANSKAVTPAPVPAPVTDAEYVIGSEDVLQINVWKETDISSSVPVRPDGKISLPLLNDVQAAGLTPLQLAATIVERLKQFISEPRVTVIVTAMNSRRAYVMGQVTRQGAVLLVSNLTVLQALSAAGGPVQFANTKKIYVLRAEGGKQQRIPFNYDSVIKGKNPEQNINLKPGDTIVVP